MTWLSAPYITITISIAALLLGCLNFVLAMISERKRTALQRRGDRLEIDRLLDGAWLSLYGPEGFAKTRSFAKYVEAEGAVQQALVLDGANARGIRYQGLLYELRDNKSAAREKYHESLRLNPDDYRTHYCLGLVLEGREAEASFRRAIDCDPNEAWPHFKLAQLLDKMYDVEQADFHYEQATILQPNEVDFSIARARFLERMGKRDEARALFERVIAVVPSSVTALVGLGVMIAEDGEWDEGIEWIQQAMRCDPNDSHPYAMMAAMYADRKEPEKALEFNAKAIQLDTTRRLSGDVSQDIAREMKKLIEMRQRGETG